MSDNSRNEDLRQIGEARARASSTKERESFDRLAHRIREQGNDSHLTSLRSGLVGAMRQGDGKDAKKINEQIRDYSLKKGYTRK